MIQLDEEMLRQLQQVELELLIEVDRICRKNCIHYTMTGGTLLGAVRHGGFIPWDDDSDIAMMRSEYEQFRKACEEELDKSRFYFQDMENTPGYRWGYGKLRRKGTLFLREHQENMPYEQGVFLDVFPRDGVPDEPFLRKLHQLECFCVRKILWSAVGKVSDKNPLKRIWYWFLYHFFGDRIYIWYRHLVKRSNLKNTKMVRALTFPLPHKVEGYKREWYQDYTDIMFENHLFMAEAGYKQWLEQEFGDFMKLPPKDERKLHPVSDIKLLH